jgi:hypothetical protein
MATDSHLPRVLPLPRLRLASCMSASSASSSASRTRQTPERQETDPMAGVSGLAPRIAKKVTE